MNQTNARVSPTPGRCRINKKHLYYTCALTQRQVDRDTRKNRKHKTEKEKLTRYIYAII